MYKFIKFIDPENNHDVSNVIFRVEANDLPSLLSAFEDFLKGCGFQFDGYLEIVEDSQNEAE